MDGSGSSGPHGTVVGYEWSEAGSSVSSGVSLLSDLAVGVHTITLTVTDNARAIATDHV